MKELTITNPSGDEFMVEQRIIEEKPDFQAGPVTIQDSSILTWSNVGMIATIGLVIIIVKKAWDWS